jgi:hypothetical protein
MFADEHLQVAAHHNHEADDSDTTQQTQTGRNIHYQPPNAHAFPDEPGPVTTLDWRC